jgi:prepilin-type processing-associated H-X9-DG protein
MVIGSFIMLSLVIAWLTGGRLGHRPEYPSPERNVDSVRPADLPSPVGLDGTGVAPPTQAEVSEVSPKPAPQTGVAEPGAAREPPPFAGGGSREAFSPGNEEAPPDYLAAARAELRRRDECTRRLKFLAQACHMYAVDHHERLPPPRAWGPALLPYVLNDTDLYTCPSCPGQWGYGLNIAMASRMPPDVARPAQTPMLFDVAGGSPSATVDMRGIAWRHLNGANIAYVDGSVRWVPRGQVR